MIQTISFFKDPSDIIRSYADTDGIIFKNTWDDWHILAEERPVFAPPEPKTSYVDIPGGNGLLDLSEALTGYPTYNNRQGSFKFRVINGHGEWFERYSDIMEFLHGRMLYAVLNDDPNWFYSGRFTVDSWGSGDTWSEIIIGYDVNPFKWDISSSTGPWLWDPFNFETGIIRQQAFSEIIINSPDDFKEMSFDSALFGNIPLSPTVTVIGASSVGINIRFVNEYLGIDITQNFKNGTEFVPDFVFYGQKEPYKIYFKGSGNVYIDFRVGRL